MQISVLIFSLYHFCRYIDVLIQLTRVEGTKHGKLLASQMMDVTIRVKAIRPYAVQCVVRNYFDLGTVLSWQFGKFSLLLALLPLLNLIVFDYSRYIDNWYYFLFHYFDSHCCWTTVSWCQVKWKRTEFVKFFMQLHGFQENFQSKFHNISFCWDTDFAYAGEVSLPH